MTSFQYPANAGLPSTDALERARVALSFLSPNCPRQEWVYIGMGVHDEFGEDGWPIFDAWSAGGDSYKASTAREVWKSFHQGGGKGFGYVVELAKKEGFDARVKGYSKPTAEQIAEREAKHAERQKVHAAEELVEEAEAAIRANQRWDAAKPATDDHPYLKKKGVKAHWLRVGRWFKKDHVTGKKLELHNVLYLPLKNTRWEIRSLQGITADGDKIYLSGGAKQGNFFPIGKQKKSAEGANIYGFAEGYATAASAHELTGIAVLCCFDVGNMVHLVRLMRERWPDAELIIFADNDTKTAEKGRGNPGMEAAFKVGKECNAAVVVNRHGGDFNDLVQEHGAEAAQAAFAARVVPTAAYEAPNPPAPPPLPPIKIDLDAGEQPLFHQYFEMLGYDGDRYFLYDRAKQQVRSFNFKDTAGDGLFFDLAPREFWEMNFSVTREGGAKFDRVVAAEHMKSCALAVGIYKPDCVRGRGAWMDAGRMVYHFGDALMVDGERVGFDALRGRHLYERRASSTKPALEILSDEEGAGLLNLAARFRFEQPGAALLLLGWIFLAPIGGALPWRPHVWITGEAGSGKTTLHERFVCTLLRGMSAHVNGDTTAAGLRQTLKNDAFPILIDESESKDKESQHRMQQMLTMLRQASTETGAMTFKGTPGGASQSFQIRSMACLASIVIGIENKADEDRFVRLPLRKTGTSAQGRDDVWGVTESMLADLQRDELLPARLLARALHLYPQLRTCLVSFTKAATEHFGSARHGDQFGTLLAGAWMLRHSAAATLEEAQQEMKSFDWQANFKAATEEKESDACLRSLLEAKIRADGTDYPVSVLVARTLNIEVEGHGVQSTIAKRYLTDHGLSIKNEDDGNKYLLIANGHTAIDHLFAGTKFPTGYRDHLRVIDGAKAVHAWRFGAEKKRALAIPVAALNLVDDGADGPPL